MFKKKKKKNSNQMLTILFSSYFVDETTQVAHLVLFLRYSRALQIAP